MIIKKLSVFYKRKINAYSKLAKFFPNNTDSDNQGCQSSYSISPAKINNIIAAKNEIK